jgi:hypothetical protein
MPLRARAGWMSLTHTSACRRSMAMVRWRIASSCWRGVTSAPLRGSVPAEMCRSSSPTRFMKNSSRLELKIDRKLTRSSSRVR